MNAAACRASGDRKTRKIKCLLYDVYIKKYVMSGVYWFPNIALLPPNASNGTAGTLDG